ncbi:MAG: FAD-binding oxidoreductase [Ideonella sp.]|nr:FAD-binding oxidoreductase [Ideonella sp.]
MSEVSRPIAHAASLYAATAGALPERAPLQGAVAADVCVVGAGYTGLSTALHLAEAGFRVVVLEAARVGWGASGRNGGQIVHSYSRDIDVIEQRHGVALANALGGMAFEGGAIIRERVARYGIDCDLKNGLLFAALTSKQLRALEAHKSLWEKHGHRQLELLDERATRAAVNTKRYQGALLDHSGGHFHPLKLAMGEAAAFESLGGTIYEQSKVTAIERGQTATVRTARGHVTARFVVVAGNAYLGHLEPRLTTKSMPCGTQIIATEPLGERWKDVIPSDFCVEDCNFLLDYFRLSADRRLLFGGGVVYGARDLADITGSLMPKLLRVFPQLAGVRINYAWTGNFLLTLSRLPEVGRLDGNIFYSQGCSGHGVTFTHLIGRLMGELIQGQAERFSLFEQLPHLPFPGGRLLRVPMAALGAWYYGLRDRLGV